MVSRVAKYFCLFVLVFSAGFFLDSVWHSGPFSFRRGGYGFWGLIGLLYEVVMCVWYWKLSRLFHFYEQGLIFSAGTIRCIKILGLLCVLGWGLGLGLRHLPHPVPAQVASVLSPGGAVPKVTVTIMHLPGFYSFKFGPDIDFGPLLIGMVIVLIAWIMEEGRKIQEEQELTV